MIIKKKNCKYEDMWVMTENKLIKNSLYI